MTIATTDERGALPGTCNPSEVAKILIDFYAAGRYDEDRLVRMTMLPEATPTPPVQYFYGVGEDGADGGSGSFVATTRGDLLEYLDGRHRVGERMRLLAVKAQGSRQDSGVDIVYYLARSAPDLPGSPRITDAKGRIDCERRKIMVASLNTWPSWDELDLMAVAHTLSSLCPPPPPDHARGAVIACAYPSS